MFDNYVAAITVGGKSYELGLFDTAGEIFDQQKQLEGLYVATAPGQKVYNIDNIDSLCCHCTRSGGLRPPQAAGLSQVIICKSIP